jgi:hypothetical protein
LDSLGKCSGEERKPLKIEIPETRAAKLRLVVADAANPPLTLTGVEYTAPMRQVIFAVPAGAALPLKLYCGNPDALSPRYDFAANLPPTVRPTPARVQLGSPEANPDYQPPGPFWSERFPWLIYVILGLSSLGLLALLLVLAREALRRGAPARPAESTPSPGASA